MTDGTGIRQQILNRMIHFTADLDGLLKKLPACLAKDKLKDQLGRSGSSIGANYAESRAAESQRDFIHKLSIALKEANDTKVTLPSPEQSLDWAHGKPLVLSSLLAFQRAPSEHPIIRSSDHLSSTEPLSSPGAAETLSVVHTENEATPWTADARMFGCSDDQMELARKAYSTQVSLPFSEQPFTDVTLTIFRT